MAPRVTKPGITVVIPTHLRDHLLADALASVLLQSRLPDEVLVIDDVGSESTADLVARASRSSGLPFRHLIRGGTAGAAASRQLGAEEALFDAVAYLDDDDLWFPWHLREVGKALSSGNCDAVATPRVEFVTGPAVVKSLIRPVLPHSTFGLFAGGTHIGGSNLAVRKHVVQEVGWDPELAKCEDGDFVIRMMLTIRRVQLSQLPSIAVRHHRGPRLRSQEQAGWSRVIEKHRADVPASAAMLQMMRDESDSRTSAPTDALGRWARVVRNSFGDPQATPLEVVAVLGQLLAVRAAGIASSARYRRWQWHLERLMERTDRLAQQPWQ